MSEPIFLYVEDDIASQRIIEIMLKHVLGFSNIHLLADTKDFMQRVAQLPEVPTIIFLDIQIKPHDGYDVLQMLRADEQFATTTIIAMTANVMSHDVEKLREAGFNGLIGKPILKEVFPELIRNILDGKAVWYIP